MKRFHVHVAVDDLAASTRFYSALFGAPPSVEKSDYAKWMLDDPRINFAISARGNAVGVNHLGFQADDASELEELHARLQTAETSIVAETGANCCYATSDKYWVTDPAGIAWENFHTLDSIPTFGAPPSVSADAMTADAATSGAACCAPSTAAPAVTIPLPTIRANGPATTTKEKCCG